jgi:hypothetical protein
MLHYACKADGIKLIKRNVSGTVLPRQIFILKGVLISHEGFIRLFYFFVSVYGTFEFPLFKKFIKEVVISWVT